MQSRIRFFNRSGIPIGEIAATTKRSWMLNNFGECTFIINKRNPRLEQKIIEYGNIVLVTNGHTKPWVGIIDLPRTWTKLGPRITAYSAEIMLSYRDNLKADPGTGLLNNLTTLNGKAGSIFAQMISILNQSENTVMKTGEIYYDGADRQETLSTDLLTHARNVAGRSGNDFDVTYSIGTNNALTLLANWYSAKQGRKNVVLEEGSNIELKEEIMIEQGIIKNAVVGVGVAELDAPSIGVNYDDADSIGLYGRRDTSVTYGTVSEIATLTENVKTYTSQNAYPRSTANVTCVDKSIFRFLSEGDVVRLILHNAGFSTNTTLGFNKEVRVLGMQANDDKSTMDLILDEIVGSA